MFSALKRLRGVILAGTVLLALAGPAMAATSWSASTAAGSPDPTDVQAPDCLSSCSKLLQPGQRLVVAAPYAFHSVTIRASATAFGAECKVRYSADGRTYSQLLDVQGKTSLGPVTFAMPGYYRVIAIDPQAEFAFATTATISITTS